MTGETQIQMTEDEQRLLRLFRMMGDGQRHEVLIRSALQLLIDRPLVPDLPAAEEDKKRLGDGLGSEWLDDQLARVRPYSPELINLDDYVYCVLEQAWPDGCEQVLLGSSSFDISHAQELLEPYLRRCEETDLPLLTEFGLSEDEMIEDLTNAFTVLIREWRENVISVIEQAGRSETSD